MRPAAMRDRPRGAAAGAAAGRGGRARRPGAAARGARLRHGRARDELEVFVARAPGMPRHVAVRVVVQHVRDGHQCNAAAALRACRAQRWAVAGRPAMAAGLPRRARVGGGQ